MNITKKRKLNKTKHEILNLTIFVIYIYIYIYIKTYVKIIIK